LEESLVLEQQQAAARLRCLHEKALIAIFE
jgi:hypothetical protein